MLLLLLLLFLLLLLVLLFVAVTVVVVVAATAAGLVAAVVVGVVVASLFCEPLRSSPKSPGAGSVLAWDSAAPSFPRWNLRTSYRGCDGSGLGV